MPHQPLAVVSLIGRTNVGKSTLFNTLLEKKRSITSKTSGTTRDRNYQIANWCGTSFYLVDTGGLDIKGRDEIEASVIKQAQRAIADSNIIIFVIDGRVGITTEDRQAAQYLKKSKKPIVLAVNKMDNPRQRKQNPLSTFLRLGFKNPILLSSINGSGTGDLLDEVVAKITASFQNKTKVENEIRLAVLGKPNVGKSSLVNSWLDEERVIVNELPHTTRDPQNISFKYKNRLLEIIDTAGVRKVRKITEIVEKTSVHKSMSIIKKTDVVLLVLDIYNKISHQDSHLAKLIQEAQKPCVIIANKWDLISDHSKRATQELQLYINQQLPHIKWAPVVLTSAVKSTNINKCLNMALVVHSEYNKTIDNKTLAQFIKAAQSEHLPSSRKKAGPPRLYSLRQVSSAPPVFSLKVNKKESLHPSYLRFLEKRMRVWFSFTGSPIRIDLKSFRY